MRLFIVLISLAFALGLTAQENHRTYHENGLVKAEYTRAGQRILVKMYHENGRLAEQGSYLDGKPHSKWRQYDENGNVLVVGSFDRGVRVGKWKHFTAEGVVVLETRYDKEGLVRGEQYDDQGKIIATR